MSTENVKQFLEIVKTDEGLARKVVELKDSLQGGAGSEVEILAEKVLPLAKAHGLDFTVEEFLAYANSVSGELSDDDLLNVSGGISARGVALGLLFATGLSFLPTIVSSFAIGGGSAPEISISQGYDAGESLQQDDEIDIDNREDDPASPQLQAAREKVERLQQKLSRKKRGKSTVSKGYMKNLQELEKAKANVERLEKIEREKTENNKKDIVSEIQEFRETKKDQQEDLGVGLADNELEEKHEERQDEINDQAENKEEELKKNEGVVEEKKEDKENALVEEKKEEVAEEKKEEKKEEVIEEEKKEVAEEEEEEEEEDVIEVVEEKKAVDEVVEEKNENVIEQQQEDKQSVEEKLVNEIQTNGSIKWTGTMVFVDYKKLANDMRNSGFFDLNVNQQKDIYQNAVSTVLLKQNAKQEVIDLRLIAADSDINQAKDTAVSKLIVGKGKTEKIAYDKLPRGSGIWKYKSCIDHIVNQVPGATEDISNFTLDKFDEESKTQILKDISWLFSKKSAAQISAGDSSITPDALNKLAEIDAQYNYRSDQSSSWDKIVKNINKGLENWDTLTEDAKETLKKDINYVYSKMGKANGTYYLGSMIPGTSNYGWNTKEPNKENEELERLARIKENEFLNVKDAKENQQSVRYVSNQTGKFKDKMDRVMVGIKDWKDGKLLEASVDELQKDIKHLGGYIYTDKDENPYLWSGVGFITNDSYGYDSSSKRASGSEETKKAKVLQALKDANYDISNESVQEAIKAIDAIN